MNEELAAKLKEFGYSRERMADSGEYARETNFGEYARELNAIISPHGFSATWNSGRFAPGVIVRHEASGRSLRMRISDMQVYPKLPLWSVRKLEKLADRVGADGKTVMLRNVGHYLLAVSDKEKTFSFEASRGEDIEIPEELLEHESFQQAFKQGYLELMDPVPAGTVRLDLDRMEARNALRSLRRTMEMVLNLTATDGETENDRQWRYISYGMAEARRLADALEAAIGPEQTLGCPECSGYGLGEGINTCSSCGGRGCGECVDGAVRVQVPCSLCGGAGEVPESLFD